MNEIIKIAIGILFLVLGIPAGDYLAKLTKEELRGGRIWFKAIIIFSLMGAVLSLIFGEDVILFSLLFIALVTSRSLKTKLKK